MYGRWVLAFNEHLSSFNPHNHTMRLLFSLFNKWGNGVLARLNKTSSITERSRTGLHVQICFILLVLTLAILQCTPPLHPTIATASIFMYPEYFCVFRPWGFAYVCYMDSPFPPPIALEILPAFSGPEKCSLLPSALGIVLRFNPSLCSV